jgi:hypothetical protein
MQNSVLDQIPFLYHFTDSRNIHSIQKGRGLFCTAELRNRGIDFYPAGNEISLDADERFGMDKYVHLCFDLNHPLEYLARCDGRIRRTTWLYIAPLVLEVEGVLYCPEVANKACTTLIPIDDAVDMIDYEALYSKGWRDPDLFERFREAQKCEILVPGHIPLKYIKRIR